MKLALLTTACAVAAVAFPASARASVAAPNWSYKTNDPTIAGPTKWGDVSPTCAGKRQSPINIDIVADAEEEMPIEFGGTCGQYNISQQYDAFKVEVQGGSCKVRYLGKRFRFAQMHVHAPSEHTVRGVHYDAEAHFVHMSKENKAIVIAVFLQRGEEEEDDDSSESESTTEPFFAKLFDALDDVEEDAPVSAALGSFHAGVTELFSAGEVFNYHGGLTVPPCSEIVNWWVLETPITISQQEYDIIIDGIKRIKAATGDGENARPTQPLNGREIVSY